MDARGNDMDARGNKLWNKNSELKSVFPTTKNKRHEWWASWYAYSFAISASKLSIFLVGLNHAGINRCSIFSSQQLTTEWTQLKMGKMKCSSNAGKD